MADTIEIKATQTPIQPSIWQLFRVSLHIFAVNFPIIYPIFLYYTVFSMLVPTQIPDFSQWQWWVISLGGIAMVYLFKAGWNAMMNQAVVEVFHQSNQKTQGAVLEVQGKDWLASFAIIKPFVGGIGEKGLTYLVVGILETLLLILPGLILGLIAYYTYGFDEQVFTAFFAQANQAQGSSAQLLTYLEKLPDAQLNMLSFWSLVVMAAVLLSALLQWFLLYWEALLFQSKKLAPLAIFKSIGLCFEYPLKTLVMGALYYSTLFFIFAISLMGELGAFFSSFLLMTHTAVMGILFYLFLYTYKPELRNNALEIYKQNNTPPKDMNATDHFSKKI